MIQNVLMGVNEEDFELKDIFMFPGNSCFPLSPEKNNNGDEKQNVISSEDQIIKILETLGQQNDKNLSFIHEKQILEYVKDVQKHLKFFDIDKKLSKINPNLRDLVKKMLVLNPNERLTSRELIKLPIFDSLRNPVQEVVASKQIELPLERDGMYDYETFEDKVSVADFQAAIEEEIKLLKENKLKQGK